MTKQQQETVVFSGDGGGVGNLASPSTLSFSSNRLSQHELGQLTFTVMLGGSTLPQYNLSIMIIL